MSDPFARQTPPPLVAYTFAEVAAMLGVNVRTIRRMVQRGTFLKPVRVGSIPKFMADEVRAYIERIKRERAK